MLATWVCVYSRFVFCNTLADYDVLTLGYMYRQQQQVQQQAQQQQTLNSAFYQTGEGMFSDPASGLPRSHFYGGAVAPQPVPSNTVAAVAAATSPSPMKPRGPKPHLNGVHQRDRVAQNGHSGKEANEGVASEQHSVATNGTTSGLETQMANLSVAEI